MKKIKLDTPIQKITFHDMDIFIKRDDLINEDFSGNKARKFYYYLVNEFPDVKHIVSYGSNQSNAMYSMSVLAKLRGWSFTYYCHHISSFLKENPVGNYKEALLNGANIIDMQGGKLPFLQSSKDVLYIPEGGFIEEAKYGLEMLADEIDSYLEGKNKDEYIVFLPSGTGTTALFLQKYLKIKVFTCACVGDEDYLKKEFFELEKEDKYHPVILKTSKKYHFGKLYKNLYMLWLELCHQTMIEFDLLYDPVGFDTILSNIKVFQGKKIIYIHQGGLKGNITMLQRYKYKFAEV